MSSGTALDVAIKERKELPLSRGLISVDSSVIGKTLAVD